MLHYQRMPIEIESPEEAGYETVRYNLAESSVSDMLFQQLNISLEKIHLEYGAHRGKKALRELIAANQPGLCADDVLITQGACEALFIIYTTLLQTNAHLLVLHPNYATHIEVPRVMGCAISPLSLQYENNWHIDMDQFMQQLQPQTALISITNPHNPTGMVFREEELEAIIRVATDRKIYLLVDETYIDTVPENKKSILSNTSPYIIRVGSLSKAYGLPGLRIGWLFNTDKALMEKFLAAKEMIHISNSVIDEEIAYQFLIKKDKFLPTIFAHTQKNLSALMAWADKEKRIEMIQPEAGVVCFARIKESCNVSTDIFYATLWQKYQTMVGPGHWFDMPDNYMRIGFGWPDAESFKTGLAHISLALDAAI